jgi:hypothetical protein
MSKKSFTIFIILYIITVTYLAYSTPISPHEARIFYSENGIVNFLMHYGYDIFGGFIGLRIFFLFIGLISIYLYYEVSKIYLNKERDQYLATIIYILLPGMITALVLANISTLIIPLVLIFLLLHNKGWIWLQLVVMAILFLVHNASVIFFISIFIYAIIHKERTLSIFSAIFLLLSIITLRGVEIGGRPSGHFVDIFGLYIALFSPLIFIYFFYTLYRILLREEKNILWYISFGALILSLILSIRQRIVITDFAPYVIISIVLMLDSFNKRVRVRLPIYQKYYLIGFKIVIFNLSIVSSIIILHQPLFVSKKHNFTSKIYYPFQLARELNKKNIKCYNTDKRDMVYQLHFYKIESCPKYKFKYLK